MSAMKEYVVDGKFCGSRRNFGPGSDLPFEVKVQVCFWQSRPLSRLTALRSSIGLYAQVIR